jgi:DNA-binding PadR family transcriptional regulator
MEKILFLLGLIRNADIHGYHLIALAESHFNLVVSITKPTAYRLLDKMTSDGWITYREEQVGNHPPRKIYSITPAGEEIFRDLLRQSLTEYCPTGYSSPVNLAFLSALPAEEVLLLLEGRRERVQTLLQKLNVSDAYRHGFQLVFQHQRRHFEAELSLTEEVIAQVQASLSS